MAHALLQQIERGLLSFSKTCFAAHVETYQSSTQNVTKKWLGYIHLDIDDQSIPLHSHYSHFP